MPTNYNFSDVFISYSRKNTEFVRSISSEFEKRGYSVWVDWEDIPQSSEWWEEICAGIDAATSYIFMLSPASAVSKICRDEIDHAVKANKRLVPVLIEQLDAETIENLHPSLKTHNWLDFTSEISFDEKIEHLLKTILLDLDYLRKHTRYLVRAQEWNNRGRDKSFLLRGTDAEEANIWIKNNKDKQPLPLGLHGAYIEACWQQFQADETLKQQQEVLRFIDRRSYPVFIVTLITITLYLWYSHAVVANDMRERLQLAFGIGLACATIMAAVVIYGDELLRLRYPNHQVLRWMASFAYCFIFSCTFAGALQLALFGLRLNFLPLVANGFAFAFAISCSVALRLRSWQSLLLIWFCIYLVIQASYASPERIWFDDWVPVYFFSSNVEAQILGAFLAFALALGICAWPIAEDILKRLPETTQKRLRSFIYER